MNELQMDSEVITTITPQDISLENRLEIIEEGIRKKYLSRLSEMQIAPITNLSPLESDLIENVRLYKITEMVYEKGEPITDKFTTVFNTLSTYCTSVSIFVSIFASMKSA